jgi:hypothetical protein
MKPRTILAAWLMCSFILPAAASRRPFAADAEQESGDALVKCTMRFSLKGWSAFYKTAKGTGTISCDNGEKASVRLKATGGGLTFGKSEIVGGTGRFTGARNLEEVLGSYVQSEAHAGAGKSADAQAMTKGEVSLSLVGKGRGVDIGFAFGKFTIERVK